MTQHVTFLLAILTLATALLAGCCGQDTPVEQAEEDAGVESRRLPIRDIASEGCPEGQVSNVAGTECKDIEEVQEAHAEGMVQVSQAEQDAILDRLVEENGLYDFREMMSDVFKEAVGTDCGFKDLSDIRRNLSSNLNLKGPELR